VYPLLELYKDHNIFIDEVAIWDDKEIEVIKNVAQQCQSANVAFWFTVSFVMNEEIKNRLLNAFRDFHVIKDELSIPLRNTDSIARHAYKIDGKNKLFKLLRKIQFLPIYNLIIESFEMGRN
jgi:hypothetical protein